MEMTIVIGKKGIKATVVLICKKTEEQESISLDTRYTTRFEDREPVWLTTQGCYARIELCRVLMSLAGALQLLWKIFPPKDMAS